MASLEKRNGTYRIVFRFAGRKFSRTLKTRNQKAAIASLARLEDNLRRVELGALEVPPQADLVTFLLSDGRVASRPQSPTIETVDAVLDRFLSSIPSRSLEQNTLATIRLHVRHIRRLFGGACRISDVNQSRLQEYVNRRSDEKGLRGNPVSRVTIQKEMATLNSAWQWALGNGIVDGPLPKSGIRYPKIREKPPFQTMKEIERAIMRGNSNAAEQADLWDSLFLTLPEIAELLEHVRQTARQPFIYPMFVFAAHTGARRSEMIRSRIDDLDLDAMTATIREKKRVRGKSTTRMVPLSPPLRDILASWLARHPGGGHTFCLGLNVRRSPKTRVHTEHLTRDEANDHFKRTLACSKWQKLRGWHVFRHSFCSNCAARGIDQRIINAWVGHQTEEMVRRYRHLIPSQQQQAIQIVFGE